jgi:type VI secretion system protein ImpA
MASAEVLDFAKLLAPISAEKPTGTDPRADISPTSLYYKIKGDRTAARAAERQLATAERKTEGSDDQNAPKPPDWKPVREVGGKLLTSQAKDLEVAAYMIEALLRLDGFVGLRDGFRLARELTEKYWEGLYPLPDEEGLVNRIAPLVGLNGEESEGTLIAPIARVPITESTGGERFAVAHYNEATNLKKITDPKLVQKKLEQGTISLEIFQAAVSETPPQFYQKLVADLNDCTTEFGKLCEVLDKRCNGQGPPTSSIRSALTACLDLIQQVAREKLKAAPAPAATPPDGETAKPGPGAPAAKPAAPPGVIQNRTQALENLRKVAEFFRTTEPHSPVSYALEQVVRWGNMALPELWSELIADEAPRKNVFKQVGIRLAEESAKAQPPKK